MGQNITMNHFPNMTCYTVLHQMGLIETQRLF